MVRGKTEPAVRTSNRYVSSSCFVPSTDCQIPSCLDKAVPTICEKSGGCSICSFRKWSSWGRWGFFRVEIPVENLREDPFFFFKIGPWNPVKRIFSSPTSFFFGGGFNSIKSPWITGSSQLVGYFGLSILPLDTPGVLNVIGVSLNPLKPSPEARLIKGFHSHRNSPWLEDGDWMSRVIFHP